MEPALGPMDPALGPMEPALGLMEPALGPMEPALGPMEPRTFTEKLWAPKKTNAADNHIHQHRQDRRWRGQSWNTDEEEEETVQSMRAYLRNRLPYSVRATQSI